MLLELEGGVELYKSRASKVSPAVVHGATGRQGQGRRRKQTSCNGTRGGPAAISELLAPGWMRRLELALSRVCSICCDSWSAVDPSPGDLGPIWISAGGGGLGRRGDMAAMMMGAGLLLGSRGCCLVVEERRVMTLAGH